MKIKLLPSNLLVVSMFVVLGLNADVRAQAKKPVSVEQSKIEKMLKELGSTYSVMPGSQAFAIPYQGKELREIAVVTVEVGPTVVLWADVAAGREVDLTPEVMKKLLEYNLKADFIKVGISDKGTITVQTEQSLLVNTENFKELIDQVAAGADNVAALLKPVRRKTAPTK